MSEFFIRDQHRVYGPYSPVRMSHLVASGQITPSWSIAKTREGPWIAAGKVSRLVPADDATPPEPQPPDREPPPSRTTDWLPRVTKLQWSVVVTAALFPWLVAGMFSGLVPGTLVTGWRPNRSTAVRNEVALQTGWYLEDLPDAVAHSRREGKDLLVIFTADWCGPCRRLKRDLAGAEAFRRDVLVCVVDCDKQRALSDLHGVQGIPDLRLYRLGEEVNRTTGYGGSLAALESWVQAR